MSRPTTLLLALALCACHREHRAPHRPAVPVARAWAQSEGELPLDRVIEVEIEDGTSATASLLVVDERGERLAEPVTFERAWSSSVLRAVTPVRSWKPFIGAPRGIVIRGRRKDTIALPVPLPVKTGADPAIGDDPHLAVATVDAVRGTLSGEDAARADAVAAEAAFAFGRTHLAASFARRGLATKPTPILERRLLRTLIVALAEAQEPYESERARLREPDETLLDDAVDLRLAELHDRIEPGPRRAGDAAKSFLEHAKGTEDPRFAGDLCRAGSHIASAEGARALERGRLLAKSVADRAMCLIRTGDAAVDAGKLDDGERWYREALNALGDHRLPREQREAWISAAYCADARGDAKLAFERARASFRWIDMLLAVEHDLGAREALFTNVLGYFAITERFGIRAGDPRRAISAGERGKGSAFGLASAGGASVDVSALGAWFASAEINGDEPEKRVREGDAVITYTLLGRNDQGQAELAIGVVTRQAVNATIVVVPNDLQKTIEVHGRAVEANDEATAKTLGAHLYASLIAPIAPWLAGRTRLLISPHLRLHALAFGALHDGERWLAERFTLARIPPLPFFRGDRERAATPRRWVTAIAPPHPPLAPLPGFEAIADDLVRGLQPAVDLRGPAVTPTRMVRALGSADALLYAGHARYEPTAPLRSALLVSSGEIRAVDVLRTRRPIDTVVLVGCETARSVKGRASFGDDAIGLQRAFLAAGARQVVGAMWPVLDRDAEDFARALLASAPEDMPRAVIEAQRCMIEHRCPARGVATWASYTVDLR